MDENTNAKCSEKSEDSNSADCTQAEPDHLKHEMEGQGSMEKVRGCPRDDLNKHVNA